VKLFCWTMHIEKEKNQPLEPLINIVFLGDFL
jgi:hypothetical protein